MWNGQRKWDKVMGAGPGIWRFIRATRRDNEVTLT